MADSPIVEVRPKAWVGIDPGQTGAMVMMTEQCGLKFIDWCDIVHMHRMLKLWLLCWDVQLVVIEEVWGVKGNSAKSNTTFQQHVGEWTGMVKILGLPILMARPDKWVKRRIRAKKDRGDKPSVEYVLAKYPNFPLSGARGSFKDGRSDALCMAEYAREQDTGVVL